MGTKRKMYKKRKKTTPKVVTRKGVKHSSELKLQGEVSQETKMILKGVRHNQPQPERYYGTRGRWDHLIAGLLSGDELPPFPHKDAASLANRGRSLGYVVRLSKIDEEYTLIWFGGFQGIPKALQ